MASCKWAERWSSGKGAPSMVSKQLICTSGVEFSAGVDTRRLFSSSAILEYVALPNLRARVTKMSSILISLWYRKINVMLHLSTNLLLLSSIALGRIICQEQSTTKKIYMKVNDDDDHDENK